MSWTSLLRVHIHCCDPALHGIIEVCEHMSIFNWYASTLHWDTEVCKYICLYLTIVPAHFTEILKGTTILLYTIVWYAHFIIYNECTVIRTHKLTFNLWRGKQTISWFWQAWMGLHLCIKGLIHVTMILLFSFQTEIEVDLLIRYVACINSSFWMRYQCLFWSIISSLGCLGLMEM